MGQTEVSRYGRFVGNGAVRLHDLDSGTPPGDGRDPIVFVPGATCVADDYVDILPAFGRRVIVLDLRGHGHSDAPQSGYSTTDLVSDIEAVVADAGVNRFHLLSFSRGAAYALPFALRHPDRVRTISIGDYVGGELGIPGGAWPPEFVGGRWRGTPVPDRIPEHALQGIARESVERRYYDELVALGTPVLVVRSGKSRGHTFIDDDEQACYRRVDDVEI